MPGEASSTASHCSSSNSLNAMENEQSPLPVASHPPQPPPRLPPKIPPPPNEHPPPYTPFGGQTSTLLPHASAVSERNRAANRSYASRISRNPSAGGRQPTPVVVLPPGLHKYTHHCTRRNLLMVGVLVALVLLAGFIVYQLLDKQPEKKVLEGTKPLEVKWKGLGEHKSSGERMSFDSHSDSIILSEFLPKEHFLKCEKIRLGDHLSGFVYSQHNMSELYSDCVRFTDEVICCSTPKHARHHRTECYLQTDEGPSIHSVTAMYDFVPSWQSLEANEKLVLIYNRQRHAVLDLRTQRVHRIEENRLPHGYLTAGFYFPMDTVSELEELVRTGDEFRICEYLRTSMGDYDLKEEACIQTPFKVEFQLPRVQFCSNPLYTAVIQFGQPQLDEKDSHLTWHLRVKYDSSPQVYSAAETVEVTPGDRRQHLIIECDSEQLNVYVLGTHELHQFSVELPNLRSEHFIQTRRF